MIRLVHADPRQSAWDRSSNHGANTRPLSAKGREASPGMMGKWSRRRYWIVVALCMGLLTPAAHGGSNIYRWQDDQGRLHFTDSPDRIPTQYWNQLAPIDREGPIIGGQTAFQRTRVPVRRKQGAILVPVRIHQDHPVHFYLDTGSTYCQITREDAQVLGLGPGNMRAVRILTADGRSVETHMVILDSLKIGSLEMRRVEAVVGDMRLLGLNVLERFLVTLDLPRGELTLEPPP
jgi:clan AA aspartic protease (TIGR02281 family)